MDVKESKGEWTAWVVGLRTAKPDREPGGHEDRRARNRGVWEQWSPGRMGAGRGEGEGLVVTAEPRESDIPWLPVARKAPRAPGLSTLVDLPLLRGLSQALLSTDLILGDPAHLDPLQATEEKQDFRNNSGQHLKHSTPPPQLQHPGAGLCHLGCDSVTGRCKVWEEDVPLSCSLSRPRLP